jgi:hypothetical protein
VVFSINEEEKAWEIRAKGKMVVGATVIVT